MDRMYTLNFRSRVFQTRFLMIVSGLTYDVFYLYMSLNISLQELFDFLVDLYVLTTLAFMFS